MCLSRSKTQEKTPSHHKSFNHLHAISHGSAVGCRGQAKLDLHQQNPSVWALRSVATQTRWQWRLLGHEAAALAPMFLQQAHVGDGHAAVHGFAHVVDGEQGHLHGGQGVIK
jgi:hypothetical protein